MIIKEIYEAFDKIGCLSFTTINEKGEPVSRIAHLRGFDDDGIYFMTMFTKDFYKHIVNNSHISICGLCANTQVSHDDDGMPVFEGGYAMRMTGKAFEVDIEEIIAKNNPIFDVCIKDKKKYPAMVVLCIKNGYGDIFDYDFELKSRENKIERVYFSYNSAKINYKGLKIDQNVCVSCGICEKKCSFKAIKNENGNFSIDEHRCDECGDCYINCPVKAIEF